LPAEQKRTKESSEEDQAGPKVREKRTEKANGVPRSPNATKDRKRKKRTLCASRCSAKVPARSYSKKLHERATYDEMEQTRTSWHTLLHQDQKKRMIQIIPTVIRGKGEVVVILGNGGALQKPRR